MINAYILILTIVSVYGNSISMQEFDGKRGCENAGKLAKKMMINKRQDYANRGKVNYICVRKNTLLGLRLVWQL